MGTRLLIVLAALAACERTSTKYCGLHPMDYLNCAAPDGALVGCTGNSDCPKNLPRCETGQGLCVQCLDDMDCMTPTPRCDLQGHECVQCASDGDCTPGSRCLVNGVCSNDNNVAYVDTGGKDNPDCTQAMPCMTTTAGLKTGKPYVQLNGTFNERGGIVLANGTNVTIFGTPGTSYTRSDGGDTITLGMGGTVGIASLEITCNNATGHAIKTGMPGSYTFSQLTIHGCQFGMQVAGSLTMTRSKIYGNSINGVSLMGPTHFEITNSMFVQNGGPGNDVAAGGVVLGMGTTGDTFEFNTVADNTVKAMGANVGGVACPGMGFTAPNNIFASNVGVMGANSMSSNTTPGCDEGSLSSMTDVPLKFVNPATTPFDYHVMPGSSAVDSDTMPDTTITEDYDGQMRPRGNGWDFGADEL
jgi:hypothetical protein